jgi:hypothetical protein
MTMAIEFARVPLSSLVPHPENYKDHGDDQLSDLKASLLRFDQVKPVVVIPAARNTYMILAGHGLTQAMTELVAEHPDMCAHLAEVNIAIVPSDWTPAQAKGYMLADNETSNKAQTDQAKLIALLEEQKNAGFDLASVGSSEEELRQKLEQASANYLADGEDEQGDQETPTGKGSLLELLDVTIAEPRHQVVVGDVWTLGNRHVLIIANVFDDWAAWVPYLKPGSIFLPYPGPMVALSQKADQVAMVLVQPDGYVAGHILDRYADIHGEASVHCSDHVAEVHVAPEPEEEDIDASPQQFNTEYYGSFVQ